MLEHAHQSGSAIIAFLSGDFSRYKCRRRPLTSPQSLKIHKSKKSETETTYIIVHQLLNIPLGLTEPETMSDAVHVETVLAVISYTLLVLLHVLALCVAVSHLCRWYCKGRIFVKVGQF